VQFDIQLINDRNKPYICTNLSGMIKRISVLFSILIANIVLLAGFTIPHHHHNNIICVESSHCQTDNRTNKHNPSKHKHEHNGKTNTDYCILNQHFIVTFNQVKQEYKYLDSPDNWLNYNQFNANISDQKLINFVPTYLYSTQPPLLFYSYCYYLNNGQGLRAPPIV